jgi:hypothetical protein
MCFPAAKIFWRQKKQAQGYLFAVHVSSRRQKKALAGERLSDAVIQILIC